MPLALAGHACAQVETEIRILMEKLQRQALMSPFHGSSARTRDPEAVIPKSSRRDKNVYDYITTTAPALHAQVRAEVAAAWRPSTG